MCDKLRPGTGKHLRAIDAKYHRLIRAEIEEQLRFEPGREMRNRMPLRQPAAFEATWERGGIVKVATQNEVASDFAEYVKAAKAGPVVVTRKGKPVAVLVGTENEEDLERLLIGHSRKLQSILESARKRYRAGRGIPHETFWAQVEAENARKTTQRSRAAQNGPTGR
jgi:prevent-host-death family protein